MHHIEGAPAESVVQLYQFQFLYAQSYAGLGFFCTFAMRIKLNTYNYDTF